jgi:hypothetical protein
LSDSSTEQQHPAWRDFERAVARFLAALDPSASVTHDASIPDKDTGDPRQRDVWIETEVMRQFPVRILVSCKRWSTKLDIQDLDAFIGEWRSSGAQVGVVYSLSGFTENALKKATSLGISCCRLFRRSNAGFAVCAGDSVVLFYAEN